MKFCPRSHGLVPELRAVRAVVTVITQGTDSVQERKNGACTLGIRMCHESVCGFPGLSSLNIQGPHMSSSWKDAFREHL